MSRTDLPEDALSRLRMLENLAVSIGTSSTYDPVTDDETWCTLRGLLMGDPALRPLLPEIVVSCRGVKQVRASLQKHGSYAARKEAIWADFTKVYDFLEGANRTPADGHIDETLKSFDVSGVHAVWTKALERRQSDPEGAITMARTLLETVCKHILDRASESYSDGDDLPVLYGRVAKLLDLAPSQHTEETFKVILGSAHQIVERLGSLRNRLSDAHGRGGSLPVRPAPRHAQLAVNLSGTLATFLVETWLSRSKGQ